MVKDRLRFCLTSGWLSLAACISMSRSKSSTCLKSRLYFLLNAYDVYVMEMKKL